MNAAISLKIDKKSGQVIGKSFLFFKTTNINWVCPMSFDRFICVLPLAVDSGVPPDVPVRRSSSMGSPYSVSGWLRRENKQEDNVVSHTLHDESHAQ